MSQKGLLGGSPPAELPEHLKGLEASAKRENGIAEAAARLGHLVLVLEADILKGRECVR